MAEVQAWFQARHTTQSVFRQTLEDPRLRWVYAERMEDTILARLQELLEGQIDLSRWPHGRAFGPELEVAWWQTGDRYDLRVYAQNGSPPHGPDWAKDPEDSRIRPAGTEQALLFGEYDSEKASPEGEPAWSTLRIPRYLRYPAEGKPGRVALKIDTYLVDGMRREQRFIELMGVELDGNGS